jgi:hypothetical protein
LKCPLKIRTNNRRPGQERFAGDLSVKLQKKEEGGKLLTVAGPVVVEQFKVTYVDGTDRKTY